MKLTEVIWKLRFVTKLERKHHVSTEEVEQVLFGDSVFRRVRRGRVAGDDVFAALGRSYAGRLLVVFFILKERAAALPISARAMTDAERRYYEKQS